MASFAEYKTRNSQYITFIDSEFYPDYLVIGFARYDSDRGGAQEDDRISGNREKITNILNYADTYNLPLKVFFLNDGPGLTLGSMWNDYASLETYGKGRVMVCTLKMLDERFTKDWLEN